MKKIIVLALALAMLLLAVSCGEEKNTGDDNPSNSGSNSSENKTEVDVDVFELLKEVFAAYSEDEVPEGSYYTGVEDTTEFIDPAELSYYYLEEFGADMPALEKVSGYAMRIPDTKSAFEIHVMRVTDTGTIDGVKELFEKRINILKSGDILEYAPEDAPLLKNAEIYVNGTYVFMLSTPDNSIAKAAIEGKLN